jgi:hypothetical protein
MSAGQQLLDTAGDRDNLGASRDGPHTVSGAGTGSFSGAGFDSMWTDMSEIVRPTRDGIHGREYISTAVDIGRKPSVLQFEEGASINGLPPLVDIPIPMIIDMMPQGYRLPNLLPIFKVVAERTGTIAIVDFNDWDCW